MTQEIIDDIVSYIESRFQVGEPTDKYLSVTGDPHIVLSCGGRKEQGEGDRVLASDLLKAGELFLYEFERYVKDKSGLTHKIYWRRKPEAYERIHRDELFKCDMTYYGISARFVVTDKPPLSEAELNQVIEAS